MDLSSYPPMYQLQTGETKRKQIQHWISRVQGFCRTKQVFLLDLNIVSSTTLFSSPTGDLKAPKELQYEVFKQLVQQNSGCWADPQQQSIYIYTIIDFYDQLIAEIYATATDDVVTVQDIQDALANGHFAKIPTPLLIIQLQRAEKEGKLALMRGDGAKIDGIKLRL